MKLRELIERLKLRIARKAKVVPPAELATPEPPTLLDVADENYTHPPSEEFQPSPEARP